MWIAKPLYESTPFVLMLLGAVTASAAFCVDGAAWQAAAVVPGLAALIGGLVLWLKRRDYRSSRSRKAFEETR